MPMFKLGLGFRPMVLIVVGGKIRPKTGFFKKAKNACKSPFNFSVTKHHTPTKLYIFIIYTTSAISVSIYNTAVLFNLLLLRRWYNFSFFSVFEKITNFIPKPNKITVLDSYVTIFSNL